MSKKSEEFDKKEKKLEEGPEEMIKRIMPLINQIMNKPPMVEVKLNLQGWQLSELAVLISKWDAIHLRAGCCTMEENK